MSHIPAGWTRQDAQRYLREENRKCSAVLQPWPKEKWPAVSMQLQPIEVWRSKAFLVQVFAEGLHTRISVNRTELDGSGKWKDGITWEELMRVKAECGRGDQWAVEVYPPDDSTVNVANMRHLFLLLEAPAYAWKRD